MLGSHPKIAWCNEFEYAVDRISQSGDWPNLDEYYEWLASHRIFLATGFEIDRSLTYPQLVNSFLVQKRDLEHKPIVGATVHRHFDRLLRIWPDARFIHLLRDGRDVARSCIGMGWAGNVWTGVGRWIEAECLWEQLSQIIPAERKIEVTYETLISEPVNTLTRLCEFIGCLMTRQCSVIMTKLLTICQIPNLLSSGDADSLILRFSWLNRELRIC